MKKNIKKLISVILAALMFSGTFVTAFAKGVPAPHSTRVDTPTVYVTGYGNSIYADKDNPNSKNLGGNPGITEETLNALLAGFADPLMNAIKTDDWQPYSDFLVNTCEKELSRLKLDENGEASDGSGNDWNHPTGKDNKIGSDGMYAYNGYYLIYDWRLDPFVTAKQLNDYIKNIKKSTGFNKVNIIGRCLGSNIVLTYLYEYGWDDVNSLSLYIPLLHGVDLVGALYSGDVIVDPDALEQYIEKKIPEEDNPDDVKLLKSIVAIMNAINMLDLPIDLVMKVYNHVYQDAIPRMLKYSFGTFPSFWSFVDDAHYEDAKKLIYAGEEEKYAKMIEKIDHFHYEVLNHSDEIIKQGKDMGIPIYNYVKYGGIMAPVCDEAIYCSDGVSTVATQSFGTISGTIDRNLGYMHIKEVKDRGEGRYISPDRLIDSSMDMFRDHTWFIKGSDHEVMPAGVDLLMADVLGATSHGPNRKYIDIDYFTDYPQYLMASDNTWGADVYPMTEENKNDSEGWHRNLLDHINFIFEKFLVLFKEITDMITDIVRRVHTEIV